MENPVAESLRYLHAKRDSLLSEASEKNKQAHQIKLAINRLEKAMVTDTKQPSLADFEQLPLIGGKDGEEAAGDSEEQDKEQSPLPIPSQ